MFLIVVGTLGGAGLLLYGIEIMKTSLEWLTEGKSHKLLEHSGKSTCKGIATGFIVTVINQKSTATTVMVVSLVNAGMLSLMAAAGVIIGANIGTTITAQLLAFRIAVAAPCIAGAAAAVWKFSKNKKVQMMAEALTGFGIMFIGVMFMEQFMAPLKDYELVQTFCQKADAPDIFVYSALIFIGFLFTALTNSSSLATGVMIAMSAQGILPIGGAVPLILGVNMGKCMPALLSSRGASRTAKRAAAIHILYNVIGTVIVVVFFRDLFITAMNYLASDGPRQVANAHTVFNVGAGIVCLPLSALLVKASDKLVPVRSKEEKGDIGDLDIRLLDTPGIALAHAHNEIEKLTQMVMDSYKMSFHAIYEDKERLTDLVIEAEDSILRSQRDIEIYLVKLAQKENLSQNHQEALGLMINVTGDIERINDLAVTIINLVEECDESGLEMSDEAWEELNQLHESICCAGDKIIDALKNSDAAAANSVLASEIKIRNMEEVLRENHIERLSRGVCSPGSGVLFVDLVGNMVRVADNIKKIGYFVIEMSKL